MNGHDKTIHSDYTHLLVAQAIGKNKAGGTNFKLTLYNQNRVAFSGQGYSGGVGQGDSLPNGNYKINLHIVDLQGPSRINPESPDNNPDPGYGLQAMHDIGRYQVTSAYGPMRARLNPWQSGDRDGGWYLHGQDPVKGVTHNCLCYGTDTTLIYYLFDLSQSAPQIVPVAVNQSLEQP